MASENQSRKLLNSSGRSVISLRSSGDAHRIALDAGLDFHLAVLDDAHDFLGHVGFDTVADLDDLLDLVAADLLDLAEIEETHVHVALDHLAGQDVAHLPQLELAVGIRGQFTLLLFDAGIAALEIETGGDLLVRLVDRIFHFNNIGFGNNVKRWHGKSFVQNWLENMPDILVLFRLVMLKTPGHSSRQKIGWLDCAPSIMPAL
jgi:hypothetical protein